MQLAHGGTVASRRRASPPRPWSRYIVETPVETCEWRSPFGIVLTKWRCRRSRNATNDPDRAACNRGRLDVDNFNAFIVGRRGSGLIAGSGGSSRLLRQTGRPVPSGRRRRHGKENLWTMMREAITQHGSKIRPSSEGRWGSLSPPHWAGVSAKRQIVPPLSMHTQGEPRLN